MIWHFSDPKIIHISLKFSSIFIYYSFQLIFFNRLFLYVMRLPWYEPSLLFQHILINNSVKSPWSFPFLSFNCPHLLPPGYRLWSLRFLQGNWIMLGTTSFFHVELQVFNSGVPCSQCLPSWVMSSRNPSQPTLLTAHPPHSKRIRRNWLAQWI